MKMTGMEKQALEYKVTEAERSHVPRVNMESSNLTRN
jgi:hypothetical protein